MEVEKTPLRLQNRNRVRSCDNIASQLSGAAGTVRSLV